MLYINILIAIHVVLVNALFNIKDKAWLKSKNVNTKVQNWLKKRSMFISSHI